MTGTYDPDDDGTLDDAVGAWTAHGPGCRCETCEGMRQDAYPDRGAAENAL